MTTLWSDLVKFWFEWLGRGEPAPQFTFSVNEIYSPGEIRNVSSLTKALYINLHYTLDAVATSSDGKILNLKGGFNYPLVPGRYIVHYVDKQNRVSKLPRVTGITTDGSQVSLELVITYRVSDPVRALEVQQPVENLFLLIQSDLKEFIRSHSYAEIFEGSGGHKVDVTLLARYIREQHRSRHLSKLFFLADVVIGERIGDPKLTEIQENFQVQQRQKAAESELLKQKKELERKVASQDAEIERIKAESEVSQQSILQKMKLQSMELERARAEMHYKQEKWMRGMDAIAQAFSAPTYPRDPREVEMIKELLGALGGASSLNPDMAAGQENPPVSGSVRPSNSDRIDALTDTLLSWLDRKRS